MALELGVRADSTDECGHVSGIAITDRLIFAAGGLTSPGMVLASSNARRFVPLATPGGVRDLLAVGDALWACGDHGLFAVSRDQGRTWTTLDLGTRGGLFGMALAPSGAIWVVGDGGFAARLHGERPEVVELGTRARLLKIYAVNGALVALGADGVIRRWTSDEPSPAVTAIFPGTTGALTALVVTARHTWIVVGDAGFVARSPDGQWYSRVTIAARVDLEGLAQTRDGTLVAVGERGHILASSDDGRAWMAIASPTSAHLWCVRRFGAGVLIGGERGLILSLAPVGEPTWDERIDVFAGERSLDDVFAEGPVGFIARGLAAVLGAPVGAPDAAPTITEHARASAFAQIYGVPLPSEARNFFQLVRGHDRATSFAELRLDRELPDVAAANLFEQLICHDQQADLRSELAAAFCGVFGIGSQGNGDTYHLEIYPWDGPRQVLHFDRGTATFSGVIADSLDSLVYLTSLVKVDAHAISRETFARGMRALHGKVSPTWHFSLDDKAPAFVRLEPKRCDSEFFFYRSRWICALLEHDGVADLDHVRELFQPNCNQVIPDEQLPARYEACEKYIPTALYAMWRAYLFDEPELGRYLEIGCAHASRARRRRARRRAAWRAPAARDDRGRADLAGGVSRARSRPSPRGGASGRGDGAGGDRGGAQAAGRRRARAHARGGVVRARVALARGWRRASRVARARRRDRRAGAAPDRGSRRARRGGRRGTRRLARASGARARSRARGRARR
ncbi:MAG: hypothetical protein NT062_22660 [Proteobacteria bacterium]|nr:hypothetical protein [Pseudomonadota bacterium]